MKIKEKKPTIIKRGKATNSEMEARIKTVIQMKLQGYARPEILEYAKNTWGIETSTTDIVTTRATERMTEINNIDIKETIAAVMHNLWMQYREASKTKNGQLCLLIIKEIARIKGIDQMTINHVIEDRRELQNLSDEDLDRLIEDDDNN